MKRRKLQKLLIDAVRNRDERFVEKVLSLGASPDPRSLSRWYGSFFSKPQAPLVVAAKQGSCRIVERLLAAGADVDQVGANNATPLTMACSRNHPEIVRRLIRAGADVEKRDNVGTPLFHATAAGSDAIVRLLLEHDADPKTVIHEPFRYFSVDLSILRLLVQADGNPPQELVAFLKES